MAPPPEKAKDSSPIRYHSRYNDPTADMVIKSTDGMHFRVQSYHMKSYRYVCDGLLNGIFN